MLYNTSAEVLKRFDERKGSLKSLSFDGKVQNPKKIFSLASETLKYKTIIDTVWDKCDFLRKIKVLKSNPWLRRVVLYDLLIGNSLHGKFKDLLANSKNALQTELARLKIKAKVATNEDLLKSFGHNKAGKARYLRINPLQHSSAPDVIQQFLKDFSQTDVTGLSYSDYVKAVKNLKDGEFVQDIHIPELLVFPEGTQLHKHKLYKEGKVIIQDKASCIPAFVLSSLPLEENAHCIDCCAAPGNKTSHLAAVLENQGKIFAFDKDLVRLESMRQLLSQAGVTNVELACKDFLTVKPKDAKYKLVKYAIVDPSCSGSGIVSRQNQTPDNAEPYSKERLLKLASFQCCILLHALSFPAMECAVYSTCSVHEEENEQVVQQVLEKVGHKFELIEILPEIEHRGLKKYKDIGSKTIRLSAEQDCTNGFFVACFKRKANFDGNVDEEQDCVRSDTQLCATEKKVRQPYKEKDSVVDKGQDDSMSNSAKSLHLKKRKLDKSDKLKRKKTKLEHSDSYMAKRKKTKLEHCGDVFKRTVSKTQQNVVHGIDKKKKKRKRKAHRKPVTS